jgi:GNAT superfamily N-acetyltransferase
MLQTLLAGRENSKSPTHRPLLEGVALRLAIRPAQEPALLALIPMKTAEFPDFFEAAANNYAEQNIANGRWNAAEALELAREETSRLLPEGEKTPDNLLFVLRDTDKDVDIGYLWYGAMTRGTKRVAFLYQLYIHAQHRRQGYGRQALQWFEDEAIRQGFDALALNVSATNPGAARLYEEAGYNPSSIVMRKQLPHGAA